MANYVMTKEESKYINQCMMRTFWTYNATAPQVQQSKSFAWTLKPALDVWYKDNPDRVREIMLEHANTYFNTHSLGFSLISGIVLAMEKERAERGTITSEAVQSIKASLMGPAAGIGDSLDFNCLRVIAAGIAIGLCAGGSVLGVLAFCLLYGGVLALLKCILFNVGYKNGIQLVEKAYSMGIIPYISKAASILGLVMVGALIASNVKVNLAWAPTFGGLTVDVMGTINGIFPCLLSLALWWAVFRQIQKGTNAMNLIWVIMGGCIVLAFLGVF